jgi:ferredoxin
MPMAWQSHFQHINFYIMHNFFCRMNTLINKADVPKFFAKILTDFEVIAPVNRNGIVRFMPISSFKDIDFSRQSDYSAKKYLLPSQERILTYKKDKAEVECSSKPIVIVMHPCDANAILNTDKVFLNDCPDPQYQNRRENTLLFVFKCSQPYENCFCKSFGTDDTTNYDLLFNDIGDKYIVSVGSLRVKGLMDGRLFSNVIRDGRISLDCKRKLDNVERLGSAFGSAVWRSESDKCLSCNACIVSCPTCYCFTMRDEPSLDSGSGERQRFWDYCYMKDHTRVAGGYIFREERWKRFRHRIYHQLRYFRERYGRHLCVGCGRCIAACPTKIDMVDIVNSL